MDFVSKNRLKLNHLDLHVEAIDLFTYRLTLSDDTQIISKVVVV